MPDPKLHAVPYPNLSITLGYGDVPAGAGVAGAAATGRFAVTTLHAPNSGKFSYVAQILQTDDEKLVIVGGTYHKPLVLVSSNARDFIARTAQKDLAPGLRALAERGAEIVVVGEYGTVAKSYDHGESWDEIETETAGCLFGIAVIDDVCWIVGDDGYCAKLDDADDTWEEVDLGTDVRLSDIVQVDDLICILGFDGVLRIVDEDEAVEDIQVGAVKPLTALCKSRAGTLVLTGDGGFVARSSDRGQTWGKVSVGVGSDLEAITELGDGTLVIVGADGVVLLSTDDGVSWTKMAITEGGHLWTVTPFGAGALVGGDHGSVFKLAPPGDETWADRENEFEETASDEEDDDDDSNDDEDSDDDEVDDEDSDDDDEDSDDDDEDADGDEEAASGASGHDAILAKPLPASGVARVNFLREINNACIYAHAAKDYAAAVRIADWAQPYAHENPFIYHSAACAYAAAGELEKAFGQVELAIQHAYPHLDRVEVDSDLGEILEWPRFKELFAAWRARRGGDAANPELGRSVDELELSVRSANLLQNAEIRWIGELVQKTESDLRDDHNFGPKTLREIQEILEAMGLRLGMDVGGWRPPAD